MKAVLYESFLERPQIRTVPDPEAPDHGVVIEVMATGLCRSDWHGWQGHDRDIRLPHVPGHELAGHVVAVGKQVARWRIGDRVTVPFVCGCGRCPQCQAGNQQICDGQFQPGFTHWGSFAEYVGIHFADVNLVRLPEWLDFVTAASLGCRFATAFRAVVDQGEVGAGQWLAVHGCGGVGLSAIMIASALGAEVVVIDIAEDKLALAKALGARVTVNAGLEGNVIDVVRTITGGGAHVSIDALGHTTTCLNSISVLRKRGKHVQVGLMMDEHRNPPIPMGKVLADELQILGSHGMQAWRYDRMLTMIQSGKLTPQRLIGRTISLEDSIDALMSMDRFEGQGITVIDRF